MPLRWGRSGNSEGADEQAAIEAAKKEQDAFVERLMAGFDERLELKLKPVREKVDGIEGRWAKLEEAAAAGDGNGNRSDVDDANLTEEQRERLARDRREKTLLALNVATNARITESEVIQELKPEFAAMVPKIKEYFQNTALDRKAQADYRTYCQNIVRMVVGEAAMAGGLRYDAGQSRFFLEDASTNAKGEQHEFLSADLTWTDPRSGRVMTPREQLEKLQIKPEEFAKSVESGAV